MTLGKRIYRCRYCKSPFLPRSSGGTKQEFCSADHRKKFHKNGGDLVYRVGREVLAAVRKELPAMIAEIIN